MVYIKPSRGDRVFESLENRAVKFCYGGLFSSPPDPPDYSAVAGASLQNAEIARDIAQQQLDWSRQQWADQQELIGRIADIQLPIMQAQAIAALQGMESYNGFLNAQQQILWENHKNAMQDRSRYERLYQPIEDDLILEAMSYDTPQRKALEAGRAQADVARSQEAARKSAMMELEGYGIDPSAVRAQALDQSLRTDQAAAQATAGNRARQRVEDIGRSLRAGMVDVGRGYPSQVAGAYGQALQGGQSGLAGSMAPQAGLANTAGGLANLSGAWQGAAGAMGSPVNWMGQSAAGIGTAGNILNQGYGNQLSAWNMQQQYSPWNLAAGIGGMWAAQGFPGFAEGGPVDAGHVRGPGGPKDDMIPARLSDNEYVIPAEVVERKGTEFFDKLIDKARKDMNYNPQYGADAPQMANPVPSASHPGTTIPWQLAEGGMVPGYANGGYVSTGTRAPTSGRVHGGASSGGASSRRLSGGYGQAGTSAPAPTQAQAQSQAQTGPGRGVGAGPASPTLGSQRMEGQSYYEWRRGLPAGSTRGMNAQEAQEYTCKQNPAYCEQIEQQRARAQELRNMTWQEREAAMGSYPEDRSWFNSHEWPAIRAALRGGTNPPMGGGAYPSIPSQVPTTSVDWQALLAAILGSISPAFAEYLPGQGGETATAASAATADPETRFWSGANPRPMFGYDSNLARQGMQNENERLAWRQQVIEAMRRNIRDRPWQDIAPNWRPQSLSELEAYAMLRGLGMYEPTGYRIPFLGDVLTHTGATFPTGIYQAIEAAAETGRPYNEAQVINEYIHNR